MTLQLVYRHRNTKSIFIVNYFFSFRVRLNLCFNLCSRNGLPLSVYLVNEGAMSP